MKLTALIESLLFFLRPDLQVSLTPRFSGVSGTWPGSSTVLTVFFYTHSHSETVETVRISQHSSVTLLKQGVNETTNDLAGYLWGKYSS